MPETKGDVPEWASFFSPPKYHAFVALIENELFRRGLTFDIEDGFARIASDDGEPRVCGLGNLAQMCNQVAITEWADLVRHHFEVMLAAYELDHDAFARDFGRARPLLKLRLYPDEYVGSVPPGGLVHRPVAPGLVAVLAYDLPTHVVTVASKHPKGWGLPQDELFAIALENVRAEEPDRRTHRLEGGATFHALLGNSFFTATHALLLDAYLSPDAELGALVCVPHRHAVLYHPLVEIDATIRAIHALTPLALGMFREGPGSITPNLYWWRSGELVHLPTELDEGTIQFAPPEEFVREVLDRLAGARQLN